MRHQGRAIAVARPFELLARQHIRLSEMMHYVVIFVHCTKNHSQYNMPATLVDTALHNFVVEFKNQKIE